LHPLCQLTHSAGDSGLVVTCLSGLLSEHRLLSLAPLSLKNGGADALTG